MRKLMATDIIYVLLLIVAVVLYFTKDINNTHYLIFIGMVTLFLILLIKDFIIFRFNSNKYIKSDYITLKTRNLGWKIASVLVLIFMNIIPQYIGRVEYLEFHYEKTIEINNAIDYITSYQDVYDLIYIVISPVLALIAILYILQRAFCKTRISDSGILLQDGNFVSIEDIKDILVKIDCDSKWRKVILKTNKKEKLFYIRENEYWNIKKMFNKNCKGKLREQF